MGLIWCTNTDITNTFDIDLLALKSDGLTRVFPDSVITYAIAQASDIINSYLNRFNLPTTGTVANPPGDLLECATILAMWHLIRYRGFQPENPLDNTFKEERDRTIRRLVDIGSNNYHPVLSYNNNMIYTSNTPGASGSMVGIGGVEYERVSTDGRGLL